LQPNFFLTVTELGDFGKNKSNGISVKTFPDLRWKRCDIKSLNLLPNVLAKRQAVKEGCDEAIFVDERGFITEGASSAFFAAIKGSLRTAPLTANILPSITRHFILKISKESGINVIEKSLTVAEALEADELFTAVSSAGITGIVKFDGKIIGDGAPGRYTKLFNEKLEQLASGCP
jgi:D-alanine transaminase